MIDFYLRALKKYDKLDAEQRKELLVSTVNEINLLETVINSIDVGILVCDEKNSLTMVNKFAMRLLPLNYADAVSLDNAIGDERLLEFLKKTLQNRDRITDKEIDVFFNGRNRLLSVNVLPLVKDRRVTGTLIYIDDITEKRKTQSRLRRAENLASLTTFAAGVAHEIKNPLGSISIYLQLLKKSLGKAKKAGGKTEKYLDVINEEMERLNRIVIDFLFAVRPINLELREGDINRIIKQVSDFISVELQNAKINCILELEENLPKILVDERLLKQVFLNLVKNAQTAMPNGGNLIISTAFCDNEIRIQLSDTGTGISEENLSKIFEPYFTTTSGGTGLGLTLVYKIIREHNGEISVASCLGDGTVFDIILPVPQKEAKMLKYLDNETKTDKGSN